MIIGTIIPNNFFAPWEFVNCLLRVAPNYSIHYAQGPYLFMNRNRLFEIAKGINESILFIDSDVVFTKIQVEVMDRHLEKLPAVTGVCVFGLPPHQPMIWKREGNDYEVTSPPEKLSPIAACGGAFFGISKEVVQALPKDPFDTVFESNNFHGEDISICHRINELGFKIYVDPELKVGHIRQNVMYPHGNS